METKVKITPRIRRRWFARWLPFFTWVDLYVGNQKVGSERLSNLIA